MIRAEDWDKMVQSGRVCEQVTNGSMTRGWVDEPRRLRAFHQQLDSLDPLEELLTMLAVDGAAELNDCGA